MVKFFCVLLTAMLCALPAYACGILEKADPKVGSNVSGTIDHITLRFSQATIPATGSVTITDAQDKPVKTGALKSSEENTIYNVTLAGALAPGKYKVRWDMLWKDCNSRTQGDYGFTVQ